MRLRDKLFGVPFSRLEEKPLPALTVDTSSVLLTLEGARAYADAADAGRTIQDISYGIDLMEAIENAPWEGGALLRDVIRPKVDFDLTFRVRSDHTITLRFVIREQYEREECLRILREAVSAAFSRAGVDFQRIRGIPPDPNV
jgi:hypothetical protein